MTALIETVGLSKRYGSTRALDQLSLKLEAGGSGMPTGPVALVGPNGAGKTTLFSLLCGFIRPSGGEVSVLGQPPGTLAGRLGALPQDALLDPAFSIARQLTFYARLQGMSAAAAQMEVERVLELVRLADTATSKPDSLSHGMRKRISLAQALLGKPELVLLDEPTAGIDPPNAKAIRDLIAADDSGATFIVSSHNLDELERLCTSVISLDAGKLVEFGAIDEVAETRDEQVLSLRLTSAAANANGRDGHAAFAAQFKALCEALPGVLEVTAIATDDWRLRCDATPQIDIAVLQMLHTQQISYRQLARGRSLEDKLYGT